MGYDQFKRTIIFPSHTSSILGSPDSPPEIFLEKSVPAWVGNDGNRGRDMIERERGGEG